jgi:transposase-like protein
MKKAIQIKGRKGQKGRIGTYDIAFKRRVARHYIEGNHSLAQVGSAYGVSRKDVSRWAKQFSCELAPSIIAPMTEQEQKDMLTLQKQIEELKEKLEYERMRNFALETMADLAKTELGIDIRKNFGAKQPKR